MNLKFSHVIGAILMLAACAAFAFSSSPAEAAGLLLLANGPLAVDLDTLKASIKTTVEELGGSMKKYDEQFREFKERLQKVEQDGGWKPGGGFPGGDESKNAAGEIAELITKSDSLAAFERKTASAASIKIPHRLLKAAITNPAVTTTGAVNILAPASRPRGIVTPPQRRFAVRDILQSVPVSTGSVEFAKESTFTNNAQIQGVGSSPAETEGQIKGQSGMTFTLSNVTVPTIAHWVPASRQVLADVAQLERYIGGRLIYGLKYEEEDEFLLGDGTGGHVDGMVNQAQAFAYGVTNQTALDTIAKAMLQLMASDYMPTGVILNPQDWVNMMLLKDSEGKYILGNPQDMTEPRLWGLPVATTNAMTAGKFIVLDATRAGYIADREDAEVRISEHHEDFFVRNMVVLLAEERSTLIIEQAGALIYGNVSHAG